MIHSPTAKIAAVKIRISFFILYGFHSGYFRILFF